MDNAIVTGVFALAGAALGSVITAIQAGAGRRKDDAAHRDDQFSKLSTAAGQLRSEVGLLRVMARTMRAGKMAQQMRDSLSPHISEVNDQLTRLSLSRDRRIREASRRAASACIALVEHGLGVRDIEAQQAELNNAFMVLRDARDLAAISKWHWRQRRKIKRHMAEVPPPQNEDQQPVNPPQPE